MTRESQDELYHQYGQNLAINDLTEDEANKLIEKLYRDNETIELHMMEQKYDEHIHYISEEELKEMERLERMLNEYMANT